MVFHNMTYYAGIGSRETKPDILPLMYNIAKQCAKKGLILRSGGAHGADDAFESGCDSVNGHKEIFLPWPRFNDNPSHLYNICHRAETIAKNIHPRWEYLSQSTKKLMSRNVYQILGNDLKHPVSCVICYTPDGCETIDQYSIRTGGTGMAICIASVCNIPIFNLKNNLRYEEACDFLNIDY